MIMRYNQNLKDTYWTGRLILTLTLTLTLILTLTLALTLALTLKDTHWMGHYTRHSNSEIESAALRRVPAVMF